ncbi:MAG: glutathione S-transferase C-terminal domain-containing protein [Pseudomonadota bacterium]
MTYVIHGALGSPYSLKVRAAMRAKRLPHLWKHLDAAALDDPRKKVKVPVIPIIERPDGSHTNDSTPFLLDLETSGEGRSILPDDPADRFACLLIEDMADEWVTKAMFHYRWARPVDADQLSKWLIFDNLSAAGRDKIEALAAGIAERQIGRMPIVGCTPDTAPIIEGSAKRLIKLLDAHVTETRFLFGPRASLADVALYGQLAQLALDPTPSAMFRAEAPYAFHWLDHVADASGADGAWTANALDTPLIAGLLAMAGDTYLPFLLANTAAIEAGESTFTVDLEGVPFSQGTFGYQAKCLAQLRSHWADLPEAGKSRLAAAIGPTASGLAAG